MDEKLQCLRKSTDRSLRIATGIVFPFERRLLRFLQSPEHDKNVYELCVSALFVWVPLKAGQVSGVAEGII